MSINSYCFSFHSGHRQNGKKRWQWALRLFCLNGGQAITFVFAVNWYGFHANLSHGKVDEDLWRLSNNVSTMPTWKTIIFLWTQRTGQFCTTTPLSLFCLWYLPIPEPQKSRVVEEYQHWLHIKLMDSLPNSYSIYFPSGIPSVSFPLPLLNFLNSLFHSHSAFFCPCSPSHPLFLSHLLSLFFCPSVPSTHPYKTSH